MLAAYPFKKTIDPEKNDIFSVSDESFFRLWVQMVFLLAPFCKKSSFPYF